MLRTSGDELFYKIIICIRNASLPLISNILVVRNCILNLVQAKCIIRRGMSRRIEVIENQALPCLPSRKID